MIGFGIVGTGGMAAAMAHAMKVSGEARIAAVLSGIAERAADFTAQHGGRPMARLAAMLADPDVEAIYIANRNRDHAATAVAALEAGKAVLCEKPFACDPAEAEAVIAAARASGRPFLEAVSTPFLPAVAEAIRQAKAGSFGAIHGLSASFGYPVDRAKFPSLFAGDSGVLLDRAVYPLTLALLVLGPVAEQRSEGSDARTVRLLLRHERGGQSDLAVSMVERLPNRMTIGCADGSVGVAAPLLKAQRLTTGRPCGRIVQLAQNPVVRRFGDALARASGRFYAYGASPYLPELAHFCAMIADGRAESPILTHRLMLDVQRIIAKARTAS